MFQRIWKPWYLWRPQQLLRRAIPQAGRDPGYRPLPVAWGASLFADPSKTIGRSIAKTGVYELTVTELIARLVRPGDTVVDAGANIGYMTVLAAYAAGTSGEVLSFEPHPQLFGVLRQNAELANQNVAASRITLYNVALGDEAGAARLVLPDGFGENDGIARIALRDEAAGPTVDVEVKTLDSVLGETEVQVLKLDVEGFEAAVLRGAMASLRARRIRNVIFEEHEGPESEVVRLFRSAGYALFATSWTATGLKLAPVGRERLAASYEPQNYLATCEPDDVLRRVSKRGWRTLRPSFARGSRGMEQHGAA